MKRATDGGSWVRRASGLSAVVAGIALLAGSPAAGGEPAPVVRTASGPVQGAVKDGVSRFLGIPFGAPPVGEMRWRPPQPPAAWTQTRQATKFGGTCAQKERGVFTSPSTNEDCLYLNVYTPEAGAGKDRRAVMVWFHGGGLFSGESDDYDGTRLAARGDVVVVTTNYRTGVLGFLSLPSLDTEGHPYANYGIMDQQLALRWVRQNIARFGGDPDRVTIFGQSGGGTSVISNLASPTAAGLFHRMINQSGTRTEVYTPEDARTAGLAFAKAVGCAGGDAQCMRAVPVKTLLDHEQIVLSRFVNHFPSIDGTVITRTAYDAFHNGHFNKVPIMNGVVYDEQAWFMPEMIAHKPPLTAAEYEAFAATFGADHASRLLARYPLQNYASPSEAEIAMARDFKACTVRQMDIDWARQVPVYAYQFEDRTAPSFMPKVSYPMGAYHTSELQFLFAGFHGSRGAQLPLNAAQQKLSDRMVDYWTNFAKTGDPNSPTQVSTRWPAYTEDGDAAIHFNIPDDKVAAGFGDEHACPFWSEMLTYRQ